MRQTGIETVYPLLYYHELSTIYLSVIKKTYLLSHIKNTVIVYEVGPNESLQYEKHYATLINER